MAKNKFSQEIQKVMVISTLLMIPLIIIIFAIYYQTASPGFASSKEEYLYFSIVTFTTLGYGDITPSGEFKIYAAIEAGIGFFFVPMLIGQLITIASEPGFAVKKPTST